MDCEQALYFSFPLVSRLSRAPREISRSPRLAHKAPVMQASERESVKVGGQEKEEKRTDSVSW